MPENPSDKMQSTVESICKLGCNRVNEIIDNASKGGIPEQLETFELSDREIILNELIQIMSVYDSDDNNP